MKIVQIDRRLKSKVLLHNQMAVACSGAARTRAPGNAPVSDRAELHSHRFYFAYRLDVCVFRCKNADPLSCKTKPDLDNRRVISDVPSPTRARKSNLVTF